MLREEFINAKRIVIKLGTNVLRNSEGEVAISRIYSFIEDMAKLVKQGKEVILVTSGAVGLGKKKLNLESTAEDGVKQACAAVGQSRLMSFYENGFGIYDVPIAQILLTEDDFSLRYRYLSLRTTLNKILEFVRIGNAVISRRRNKCFSLFCVINEERRKLFNCAEILFGA